MSAHCFPFSGITLVVSETRALLDYLERTGRLPEGRARWVKAATANDVRGCHVLGSLPYDLAALAVRVTVPRFDVPEASVGGLSVDEIAEHYVGVSTYRVDAL